MEHISYDRLVHTTIANGNLLRLFGDGGQIEMRPVFALVLQDVSDQIIDMQPLHHQDDDALLLIVEASGEGGFEPADDSVSSCLRHGVFRLERIIDNDVGAADTGQGPADRGCIAKAQLWSSETRLRCSPWRAHQERGADTRGFQPPPETAG